MITRFCAENEVHVEGLQFADMGRVARQSVLHHDQLQMRMFLADLPQQSLGRVPLAVVLVAAVLFLDRLGSQGNHFPMAGVHQHGRQHLVLIRDFAGLLVHLFQAGVAVDGGGGKISGAVQGQQVAFLVENERLQGLPALHLAKDRVEQRAQLPRLHGIENLAHLRVGRDGAIRNRLRMFSSLRRSSKASKEGSFRENMANADMSVSGNEIGLFRVRGSETFSHSPRNSV